MKHSTRPLATTIVRWAARVLSVLILLFWGFFLVAHLVGEEGRPSRPLRTGDIIGLTSLAASLVGLALAWKWEVTGAAVTLLAVLIGTVVNWRVLVFPGTLIPIAACMFLSSWLMNKAHKGSTLPNSPMNPRE